MNRPIQLLALLSFLAPTCGCTVAHHDLAAGFRDPPASARPHTWWHWMNGNITREGITADLEAMKRIGLGGAQIFNVSESIPDGPAPFMSPQWRELVKHAVSEADRLGIELCMHNCAGWSSSGGPWITPEFAMQMVVSSETHATGPAPFAAVLPQPATHEKYYRDIAVLAFPTPRDDTTRIADIKAKAGYEAKYGQRPDLKELPADAITRRDAIVDLTTRLDADGRLTWDVPAGEWTILRIGHTPTGAVNAPSPVAGRGLECDKLSRAGLDAHWAGGIAPILADLGPLAGKTLKNLLIDSYEVGGQNWTPAFREEFKKRRGYDPLLYLPTLTGRVIDSGETSERFLWDFRRTIADLFADNYYSYFAELCHKNKLVASIEPYDGPFECLLCGRDADIPMGEFWVGGGESNSCKLAASVAHIYGRTIVGAESFTAEPGVGKWLNHPASLKSVGDLMYCAGINRYIIHRYAHQPWLDRFPGMTMGQWGTHFERTTTWWDHGGPEWVKYLTRCQYLLQQGHFVADVLYFAGEEGPNGAAQHMELKAKGYDYDTCNADVLRHATAKNGRIVLSSGQSYRVLVLPDTTFMTSFFENRLNDLIDKGAIIIGPKPTRSPTEVDQMRCGVQCSAWPQGDGGAEGEHAMGKGRVIWGRSVENVLAAERIEPDCTFSGAMGKPKIAWIHRTIGDTDIYFVSNQRPRAESIDCSFRVSGRVPELWHPDSGTIENAPIWSVPYSTTTYTESLPHTQTFVDDIHLEPFGSVFVVFRKRANGAEHIIRMMTSEEFKELQSAVVPWQPHPPAPKAPIGQIQIRKAVYEAIDGAGGADVTPKVAEFVAAGETSIPANNATFGDPTYMHVKRLRVEYTVDGKPATATADENGVVELLDEKSAASAPPNVIVSSAGPAQLTVTAFGPAHYKCQTSRMHWADINVESVPPPVEISGPWTLRFPANWGAPSSVQLDKLISWSQHSDPGVRYFSGTAEYEKDFDIPPALLAAGQALYLDLGQVSCIAEVTLNGTPLGTWWKPLFAADISTVAKPGKNVLKVRVTNLWVNRLVGDEQYPDDCEWNGIVLKRWPDWLVENKPRPSSQRLTFTTWKHWKRDSPLIESGLIGPVVLRPAMKASVGVNVLPERLAQAKQGDK